MDYKKGVIFIIAIIYILGLCVYFGYNWINKLSSNSNPISSQNESDKQKEESYKTIEDPWTLNVIAHEYMGSQEYDKAMPFLLKAAEKKQKNAINTLGCIYLEGLGVAKDYKKAIEYFKQSVELGHNNAYEFILHERGV